MKVILILGLICILLISNCSSYKQKSYKWVPYKKQPYKEAEPCVVQLENGRIRGNCSDPQIDAYTNIRYATACRLEEAKPVGKWKGTLKAVGIPISCIEFYLFPNITGNEDCNYVNVYVPKHKKQYKKSRKLLPVMLYITAGTLQLGSPANNPRKMMSNNDRIVVTIEYRKGFLGFLSMQDKYLPGNQGSKDQLKALAWVQKNIRAFKGDPNNIQLFSSSGGGISLSILMHLKELKGVSSFVSMGALLPNKWAYTTDPKTNAIDLAKRLKCPYKNGAVLKKCIQSKPLQLLWDVANQAQKDMGFSIAPFGIVKEPNGTKNAFLTQEPMELLKSRKNRNKPFLYIITKGSGNFPASRFTRNVNGTVLIEELNLRWYELCPKMFFYEKKPIREQIKLCWNLRKRYMCNKPFTLESYKLLEQMFSHEYYYRDYETVRKVYSKQKRPFYVAVADLPLRYGLGNLASDNCFGSGYVNDLHLTFPLESLLPAEPEPEKKQDTALALIGLIKSVSTQKLQYKHICLRPYQCLYFTYGKEHVGKCLPEPLIKCDNIPSIKCPKEYKQKFKLY